MAAFLVAYLGSALAHESLDRQLADATRRVVARPTDAVARFHRAELYRVRGEVELARADYRAARALDPQLAAVDLGLADLMRTSGELDAALGHLERFLQSHPEHESALVMRGRVHAARGDAALAAADFGAAIVAAEIGRGPQPEYYIERAAALEACVPPQTEQALQTLEAGLRRLDRPTTLLRAAVEIEMRHGRFDAAAERIAAAFSGDAEIPPSWAMRRAELLERAGCNVEARSAYARALARLSALPPERRGVPAIARQTREIEQALSRLDSLLVSLP